MGLTQAKAVRMEKAAKLKYGQDMTHKEIASELELSLSTVDNYFSNDQMKNFQRIFSDKEKFELQRVLEQQIYDAEKEAEQYIREAVQDTEASPADKIRAGKEYMNVLRKKVDLLQQMGVIQKPTERKEVKQTQVDSSSDKLAELYKQKMEEEVEQDAE